jgi:hypothetical protein
MRKLTLPVIALLLAVALALPAAAGVGTLWYREVVHEGRIYVFNDPSTFKVFPASKEMGTSITKPGYGPNGETVVFENETALDLYDLRHGRDSEPRANEAPEPPRPLFPTALKIGDGELRISMLLQAWYVMDDSEASTGTSQLGNTTGVNTFRARRAEVKLSGTVVKGWGFEVVIDPAKTQNLTPGSDGKVLQDFAISFRGLAGHEVALGQKKIYLTEEGVRSSSALDFVERSVVTRAFSDRRELGLFWKADWSPRVTTWLSATQGTAQNNLDDNDALSFNARVDFRPGKGFLAGVSAGTSAGEGRDHLGRDRWGAHVRWDGGETLPLGLRAEYYGGRDEQRAGGMTSVLNRRGWYLSALYGVTRTLQLGLRYEAFDRNEDSATSDEIRILTGGVHYFVKGNNMNLKLNAESIADDGRRVNGVLDESYLQGVFAAQVSF